jgi:phosphoribosyl-AMP cyclohydrolase
MQQNIEEDTDLTIDFGKIKKIEQCVTNTEVVPVAVQDVDSKQLLIVAYANKEALDYSIQNGIAAFWSTSRNELWVKGKTSGDILEIVEIRVNCEQNSLLYIVRPKQAGVCHTKDATGKARKSCYYRKIDLKNPKKLEFV